MLHKSVCHHSVPHLKGIFELTYAQTMLIQFTFFSAYFLVAMPAARLDSRLCLQPSACAQPVRRSIRPGGHGHFRPS